MKSFTGNVLASLSAAGTGAALMFLFDPQRGTRRRAFLRDKASHFARRTQRSLSKATRDLGHRTQGVAAEARSRLLNRANGVDDEVLVERVRSKIGRVVSHPSAIEISAHNGRVALHGDVLQSEMGELLSCVSAARGVTAVENELKGHPNQNEVRALQADGSTRLGRTNFRPAPGTRLLLAAAGGALAVYGARRGGARGRLLEAVGVGLLGSELRRPSFNALARILG